MASLTNVYRPGVARERISLGIALAALLTLKRSLVLAATARCQMNVLYVLDKELVQQEHLAALSARMLVCVTLASGALDTLLASTAGNSTFIFRHAACPMKPRLTLSFS